jgi:hypothetical protein
VTSTAQPDRREGTGVLLSPMGIVGDDEDPAAGHRGAKQGGALVN